MARLLSSKRVLLGLGIVVILLVGGYGARVWATINSIEREAFDRPGAEQALATVPEDVVSGIAEAVETDESDATLPVADDDEPQVYELPATDNPNAISPPLPDEMFTSILLIGADASGARADAIILLLLPADGSDPLMVSIPRDLYVENPCTKSYTRINANLFGCGDAVSGPVLLSLAVERFTGVSIDNFALVDFDGFSAAIDAVGGVQLCFDYPVRDVKALLEAPAGCQNLDGDTALAWARSRSTQELRDGRWQGTGASDFTRQEHQQQLLFTLLRKVASFSSIGSLQGVAQAVAETVTLSDGFTVSEAVGIAWQHRAARPADVNSFSLEAAPYVTESGAWVLQPEVSFNALLAEIYPDAYIPVVAGG